MLHCNWINIGAGIRTRLLLSLFCLTPLAHAGPAAIAMPGKRMLSSMTPTIFLKNNKTALVIGTPGGSTIFTSVFQVILNIYNHKMPLQTAVDATRYHHQLPDALLIRHDHPNIPSETVAGLATLGYTVESNSWGDLGDIQAILVSGKEVEAASDHRGRGAALVFRATQQSVNQ